MNFTRLLNQVLSTVQKKGNTFSDSPLNSFGGGAPVASVASMLLNGKNRKTITKIGSTAALGYLAYRGYQMWQQNKGRASVTQSDFQPAGETEETYSRTVLRTMIAAASDGMIDEAERRTIEQESGTDPETAGWLAAEYRLPASIEDIAASVGNDEVLAAEAYLAARLVCADLSRKETVFLARLSQALELDDNLVENLERQLGF
ncbi:TPA: tellurite resistance TerB family protein [Neisseria lactamica]